MIITDILLCVLIGSVLYAVYILRQRMKQMDEYRKHFEEAHEQEDEPSQPEMIRVGIRAPSNNAPHPKVMKYEKELDKLYSEMDTNGRLHGTDWDLKENELIGKMVDTFIKEADRKLAFDTKPHTSGSK